MDKVAAECLWNQFIKYAQVRAELEKNQPDEIYGHGDLAHIKRLKREFHYEEAVLKDIFTEATRWQPIAVEESDDEEYILKKVKRGS